MTQFIQDSVQVGENLIKFETGKMAKQAHGAVLLSSGETMCLVTTVAAKTPKPGTDFLPLTCEYVEKTYAAGRIPGSFFRREGRPAEREILVARLIDRPIRPMFPKTWRNDTQVMSTVLSMDGINASDVLSITGASAALHISDIPFDGPIAGIRVGCFDGKFKANPAISDMENSTLDVVMAVSRDAILMVEGEAKSIDEETLIDAMIFGHEAAQPLLDVQDRLREQVGKPKREVPEAILDQALIGRVTDVASPLIADAITTKIKQDRYAKLDKLQETTIAALVEEYPDREAEIISALESLLKTMMRNMILDESRRIDGRGTREIRPITIETGLLPRAHGSALFTRGETQALVSVTFGTKVDEQKIDALSGEYWDKFLLHYNFPPFATGESKGLRGVSRREIGHGNLAKRALSASLPEFDDFPYTIRVVSEVLESNGSSSMATVCGGSLALMDAGAPVKDAVAGIAMGLIKEGDRVAILTDILGDEDHLGDMDFKLAGSRKGINALQMDIKIAGLSREILTAALSQANEARLNILDTMEKALAKPREELSPYAPRIFTLHIKPDKIKDVIGPGGKMIKSIIEQTGVIIDVEDSGRVSVASPNVEAAEKAIAIIKGLTEEPEVGKIYKGKVVKIMDFGAFVEILPGTDGLCHISELDKRRVNMTSDVVKEGDEIMVKVLAVDKQGKIRLSRREAMADLEAAKDGGSSKGENGRGNGNGNSDGNNGDDSGAGAGAGAGAGSDTSDTCNE